MGKIPQSLEEIADAAGITVAELVEVADKEPQLSMILKRYPVGEPSNGVPLKPSEFERWDPDNS